MIRTLVVLSIAVTFICLTGINGFQMYRVDPSLFARSERGPTFIVSDADDTNEKEPKTNDDKVIMNSIKQIAVIITIIISVVSFM